MESKQKHRINSLSIILTAIIFVLILISAAGIFVQYPDPANQVKPASASTVAIPEINPVQVGKNEIAIPVPPTRIVITAQKNQSAAIKEAITVTGEAVETECQWNDEKLANGDYDKFATMHIWTIGDIAFSQAIIDKSVCPDK
ncbi:MAG: hypothetical protein NTZ13_04100 [Candidatus Parcubacteria bacterium]|nr:hypothetical protein [Candidatus Parcubacteria bacterium]